MSAQIFKVEISAKEKGDQKDTFYKSPRQKRKYVVEDKDTKELKKEGGQGAKGKGRIMYILQSLVVGF